MSLTFNLTGKGFQIFQMNSVNFHSWLTYNAKLIKFLVGAVKLSRKPPAAAVKQQQ